jgi:hypothetical protein
MKAAFLLLAVVSSLAAFATDQDDIKSCLRNWGKHPFSKEDPDFRTIGAKVKVMGIGDDMIDNKTTKEPELVLLKPAVNVMAKNVINLLNPNGWYCMSGRVDVLGRTEINVNCKAHLAASAQGANVMGADETETGVTVLGKTTISKIGCKEDQEGPVEVTE